MPSPVRSKAWRMPMIAALGATLGIVGFLSAEAVLARSATAEAPVIATAPATSPRERVSRRERRQRLADIRDGAFRDCAEARAAGAAPVYAGDPGYGEHLDGDLDGIGCEPHRTGAAFATRATTEATVHAPVLPRERVSPQERVQRSAEIRDGAFRNCSEARAAGAAPVYAGDPGYGEHLDRDLDGIGCEPYRRR